ncbi:nitrate- and nitrite sensing domain-containing protein [Nocardia otitidiscaviarum]|nr:nitrate- and nitrite sensing domain-containing protein [Nocardia otitidiscaviarum]MBF6483357.1 nitrate- and nitrite sensing domain-containing protein [Nocardia otitidiscaviarum]
MSALRRAASVRTRVLVIVLIPSIALLAIGVGGSAYLVQSGREADRFAELARGTSGPSIMMIEAFQEERRLSLLFLAGDDSAGLALPAARKQSDAGYAAVVAQANALSELRPDLKDGFFRVGVGQKVPALRAAIDARAIPAAEAFTAYSMAVAAIVNGWLISADVAPESHIAVELYKSVHALRAAESISQTSGLGSLMMLTGELSPELLVELTGYIGDGRGEVAYIGSVLQGAHLDQWKAITASTEWQRLRAMEDAIIQRGPVAAAAGDSGRSSGESADRLPLTLTEWQQVAGKVRRDLLNLWENQSVDAHFEATEQGNRLERNSLSAGAGVLALALLAFLGALVLANKFIARLHRLRRDTLELADERLPETIRRLSAGEEFDQDADRLDFGSDEIGHVADAFNRAHRAAVNAAVAEAKTRAGVNAVFVKIAHRSQSVVHRQLALLDKAEREEPEPDRLKLLFQLDHLATRARRNSENLIVLGGEQPGRKWRNPVPLIDVVRGAGAESLDYTRIHVRKLPETQIIGPAVTDIIHLLAELADNATTFSPPESPVEITGALVGKGIAIEISDQGLGMTEEDMAARNALLAQPPDFSVATLAGDIRLGLFVVAKLAARHRITVRLTESVYGGVKAIVLIPNALTTSAPDAGTADPVREQRTPAQPEYS